MTSFLNCLNSSVSLEFNTYSDPTLGVTNPEIRKPGNSNNSEGLESYSTSAETLPRLNRRILVIRLFAFLDVVTLLASLILSGSFVVFSVIISTNEDDHPSCSNLS